MLKNLPVKNPRPDAKRFIDYLMGRTHTGRPPLVEYLVDETVMRPVLSGLCGRTWPVEGAGRDAEKAYLDNFIEFWYRMGYDIVRYESPLPFPQFQLINQDPAPHSHKERAWADQHHGAITSWEDFEKYPWPRFEDADFFGFEYLSQHLPDGMGLVVCHAAGIYEHLSSIMSYEGLCMALYDNPELVEALAEKVGGLMEKFYAHLVELDRVVAIFPGDDMGFRTGTLIAPDHLRKYALPWHKRFAALAHQHGLPYFLHSCGNVISIMDDLIDDVGIDGKHSYEDVIIPAEDFQSRYGSRIAVLGGVDVHRLTTNTPEEVRQRVHQLIEVCGGRGRYAIGSGNSIPSYIPVENYLAMVDEALEAA